MVKAIMVRLAFAAALCAPLVAVAQSDAAPAAPTVPELDKLDAAPTTSDATPPAIDNPAKADPTGHAKQLYDKMRSGDWLPAVGIFLMFIVWIVRFGLGSIWKWFDSKLGGYVIAFGSAFVMTFAVAFKSNEGLSFGLIMTALAGAWVASGQLESLKDAWKTWKAKRKK
ncbi:hypothetical protein LCGC14_3162160 [marine sediment metagenome]|uniref:Uncharacterized protein n=1 Tax=marine sediment metagenome TaxID=412755 RepID=A0A0F8VR02_9ZZZZ